MDFVGVYILTNPKTGEFYVGSTEDLKVRIDRHVRELNQGIHHCGNFQLVWNKNPYFNLTLFPTESRNDAYVLEQELFDRYKDSPLLLNVLLVAKGGGDTMTRDPNREERIKKIQKGVQDRINEMTKEEKQFLFGRPGEKNGMWGRTHTEEVKKRISELHRGNTYNLGAVFSADHRRKISEHAAKRVGELNPFFGKTHSEETRKRLSEVAKARDTLPPNTRKVTVDKVIYESLTEAARQLKISPALMVYRINSSKDKYSGYSYLTEMPND